MGYPTTLFVSRVMAENQEIDLNAWQKLDLLQDEASDEGMRAIRYFAHMHSIHALRPFGERFCSPNGPYALMCYPYT